MVSGLVTSPCDQLRIFSGLASWILIASKSVIGPASSKGLERNIVCVSVWQLGWAATAVTAAVSASGSGPSCGHACVYSLPCAGWSLCMLSKGLMQRGSLPGRANCDAKFGLAVRSLAGPDGQGYELVGRGDGRQRNL